MGARADAGARSDPLGDLHPIRRTLRYYIARVVASIVTRAWLRFDVEGRQHLPTGPAIYAFNHLSWVDPFVLMATLPLRPRLSFFGPKEEDMRTGGRNRLMLWTGSAIPYKPGKNDLLEATRRVGSVIGKGGVLAIAGEGRIGAIEGRLLPLNDGAAYFALRSRVPLVPIAINGTSWLRFGARVRVRVGEPIAAEGRPDRATVDAMTSTLAARLGALLDGATVPERTGRIAAWMTERFNEWPEGTRDDALAAQLAGTTPTDPDVEHAKAV
jgi:1-acyl-sn-glycerol-3-phosphate acyltransferase